MLCIKLNPLSLLIVLASVIVPGAASATTTSSLSTFEQFTGEAAGDIAGTSVSNIGDTNGDGYEDFLIGASYQATTGTDAGSAYLFYGNENPLTGSNLSLADAKFTGEGADDQAGYRVTAAGDVNGDGLIDFLIGARSEDTAATDAGAVYLWYGLSTKYSGTISLSLANAKFTGTSVYDNVGEAVSSAGDVNGDGYDDFLIGTHHDDDGGSNAGAGYLVYGQAAMFSGTINLASSASAKFTGEAAGDGAGYTLSAAGDLNNDGYDDFIIATLLDDYGYAGASTAYLYYGSATQYSGTTSLSNATVQLLADGGSSSGSSIPLFSAGDMNGDHYDDLFIATYHESSNYDGVVYLMYGEATPWSGTIALSSADAQFTAEALGDTAGFSYALGDLNADSLDDLVIGAPNEDTAGSSAGAGYVVWGSVSAYSGTINLADADLQYTGETSNDGAGHSIATVDTNGDGFMELLIGAKGNDDGGSGAGAVYLGYLYLDQDGDGSAGTEGLLATGTDCDDIDATVSNEQTYYLDADGDGLGDPAVSTTACSSTAPDGYVNNADDTNDTTSDLDTNPPAEVTLGFIQKNPWNKTITLNWTNPSDTDFDHIQIERTDHDGTVVTLTTTETSEQYIDSSIEYGMTYTYTLSTVDTTGNISAGVTTDPKRVRSPHVHHLRLRARDAAIVARWERLPLRLNPAVGYIVYYGTTEDDLTSSVDVGNARVVTIPELVEGQLYYVAVTVYNGDGVEGPLSPIKSVVVL